MEQKGTDKLNMLSQVTVVVPAYNESKTIRELVHKLKEISVGEIIVIDDGSNDGTAALAEEAGAKVIIHQTNLGYFSALRTGYTNATHPIVVFIDADLQQDPSEMRRLVSPIVNGEADMVIGSKFLGKMEYNPRFTNLMVEKLVRGFIRLRFGVKLTNAFSGYRAIKRELILGLHMNTHRMEGMVEMTINVVKAKGRVTEVPRTARKRKYGKSHVKVGDGLRIIKLLIVNIL